MKETELSDKQKEELLALLQESKFLTKYNRIVVGWKGEIELYVNYLENHLWNKLNYDDMVRIHWFEFLTKTVLDNHMILYPPDFLRKIFTEGVHPLEAFKMYKK